MPFASQNSSQINYKRDLWVSSLGVGSAVSDCNVNNTRKECISIVLPRDEQTTTVNWEYVKDTLTVSTSYPPHARALEKLGYTPVVSRRVTKWNISEDKKGKEEWTPAEWEDSTWTFTLPADCFRVPKPRAKRQMSEEQKLAAAERMRRGRKRGD